LTLRAAQHDTTRLQR